MWHTGCWCQETNITGRLIRHHRFWIIVQQCGRLIDFRSGGGRLLAMLQAPKSGIREVRIREARVADAAPLAQVLVHTFLVAHHGQVPEELWQWRKREWTPQFVAGVWERTLREIADATRPREGAFVAEAETRGEAAPGEIVGIARGEPAAMNSGRVIGEITALYVHPDYQGSGVGRGLLQAVAAHLSARGMTQLQIGTLITNAPARRFYERMGGKVISERDIEDAGHPLREVLYGWPDITTLFSR